MTYFTVQSKDCLLSAVYQPVFVQPAVALASVSAPAAAASCCPSRAASGGSVSAVALGSAAASSAGAHWVVALQEEVGETVATHFHHQFLKY